MTFGQAFGALVRAKRGQEGLTQRELAARAFDDESKVRRIIDLEKGAVRRPHVKTLDPLVVYFGITKDELAECERQGTFTQDESVSLGVPRLLLESLAARFDNENPEASDQELLQFIQGKAIELREIRNRLANLEKLGHGLDEKIRRANEAIDEGRFPDADAILADAEETGARAKTIEAISVQSGIRSARADAALFDDDLETAASHYRVAAEYFLGFEKIRTAALLVEFAGRIYELTRRSWNPRYVQAIALVDLAQGYIDRAVDPDIWREAVYCSALLKQSQGRRREAGGRNSEMLTAAIEECTAVLRNSSGHEFDWARSQFLLANCYMARGESKGSSWKADIREAIRLFEEYLAQPRTEILDAHRPAILNGLSAALRLSAGPGREEDTDELRRKRKQTILRSLEESSDRGDQEVWSAAQHNLGMEFKDDARKATGDAKRFLLIQAIAACTSSLEVYPETAFSVQAAGTHLELAGLLIDLASAARGNEISGVYFERAQRSLYLCEIVFDEMGAINEQARTQFNVALLCLFHAELGLETERSDLEEAQRRLTRCEALAVSDKDEPLAKRARELQASAASGLRKLDTKPAAQSG